MHAGPARDQRSWITSLRRIHGGECRPRQCRGPFRPVLSSGAYYSVAFCALAYGALVYPCSDFGSRLSISEELTKTCNHFHDPTGMTPTSPDSVICAPHESGRPRRPRLMRHLHRGRDSPPFGRARPIERIRPDRHDTPPAPRTAERFRLFSETPAAGVAPAGTTCTASGQNAEYHRDAPTSASASPGDELSDTGGRTHGHDEGDAPPRARPRSGALPGRHGATAPAATTRSTPPTRSSSSGSSISGIAGSTAGSIGSRAVQP